MANAPDPNEMQTSDSGDHAELEIQVRVGAKIRALRHAGNMKAVELALKAGISASQLSKIETGKSTLSIKVLARICDIFDRPLSYLFQSEKEEPRTFGIVGTLNIVDGPEAHGMRIFAQDVGRMTQDRLALMPLRAPQLGTGLDQIRQLRNGQIEMLIEDLALFQEEVRPLRWLSLPYAFSDEAHRAAFLSSTYFADHVLSPLRAADIRLLNPNSTWRRGVEWVLAANRPVLSPTDVKGLRVRVRNQPAQIAYWRRLGAEPVITSWADVRSALERGAIDAVLTAKAHLYPLGFSRWVPYATLLGDVRPALVIAVNETKFQALSPELQTCLCVAAEQAGTSFNSIVEQSEQANEPRNIEEHGAHYFRVPLSDWKAVARDVERALLDDGVLPSAAGEEIRSLRTAPR